MGAAERALAGEPIAELNMTPLIDVLLVLLIMFIITVPIQTHSVPIDLPTDGPTAVRPDRNKIAIEPSGTILWNGAATDLPSLRRYLEVAARLQPSPELQLHPHAEARYEVVDQVLATIKRSNVPSMGFVGNEAYGSF